RGVLDRFHDLRVHVIGDTIVDTYTRCAVIGGGTKTPTMSVRFEEKQDFVGGAGIVAKHLASAGTQVTFSTVLGDDATAEFVKQDLGATDINF
ncbi:ADP-heptose synthase, partial [Acinetobacter johnsonii]